MSPGSEAMGGPQGTASPQHPGLFGQTMVCFFCPYLGVQVNPGPAGILAGDSLSGSAGSWGCISANAPAKLCKQTGRLVGQAHWLANVSGPGSAMHSTLSSLRSHPARSSMNTPGFTLWTSNWALWLLASLGRTGC